MVFGVCLVTRLVVRNLSTSSTVESVEQLFSRFGAVQSIDLAIDVMTGRCGGFGYVRLAEVEAGSAVAALDGLRVDGRALRVSLEQKSLQQGVEH